MKVITLLSSSMLLRLLTAFEIMIITIALPSAFIADVNYYKALLIHFFKKLNTHFHFNQRRSYKF